MNDPNRTVMVACAALGKELREIIDRYGWNVELRVINARLHNRPQLITGAVAEKLAETQPDSDRQVVVYGHCGAPDLDPFLKDAGVERTLGPHCYEMFGGEEFVRLMEEEPGTFFLTDFLVKSWKNLVLEGLRLQQHPELKEMMFGNYRRVAYLVQVEEERLLAKAREIAEWLELPLVTRVVGYGHLEERLAAIMEGKPQPTTPVTVGLDGLDAYPTLQ
ncbi:MAG: DUF1638 domain-containing protein [bacterium]|nr:DUF1638 domain-containing protein [Acidimicrobiia bacterium]MCY4651336.1 DUF1638 domain-containing protein [bacterium]